MTNRGLVIISFDILHSCQKINPRYRVFVNDELLTERTYIWKNPDFWIRERCPLMLPVGINSLVVQSLTSECNFEIRNFMVNNDVRMLRGSSGKFHIELLDYEKAKYNEKQI